MLRVKSIAGSIVIGLTAVVLTACEHGPHNTAQSQSRVLSLLKSLNSDSSDYVMVIAHRGCWQFAPENSVVAIENCIAERVDMVELDVRSTSDGVLVLLHDESLDRTTTGRGSIESVTYANLQNLYLNARDGKSGAGVDPRQIQIPTLKDALLAAKEKILVNIDAKANLYDKIFKVVDATGTGDQVVIKMRAAPDDPNLKNALFHGRALFMPVIVQCGVTTNDPLFCANDLRTVYNDYLIYNPMAFEIVYRRDDFLLAAISSMKKEGRVWVNTLHLGISAGNTNAAALADPEAVWGALVDNGVNMIQTDNPRILIQFLQKTDRRGSLESP